MELKEFDDLINLGRISKVIKLGGHEIKLRTLSSSEYGDISRRFRDDTASQAEKWELMQRELVAAAIEAIDGKKLPHQDKLQLLGAGQFGLSNLLYDEYSSMMTEQGKILIDAKKNSSQATPS